VGGHSWQSYDSVADAYERAWHSSFESVARDLVDLVAVASGEAVLDVGTGTGVVAAAAAGNARRGVLVGVDPSVTMLGLARAYAPLAPVAARSPGLPFAAGGFDVVVANLVITHFERYDTALADMARVLRPGGRLGVTAWGSLDEEPVDDGQQRQFAGMWRSIAGRFVDLDAAEGDIEPSIPWEQWFTDPARLRAALKGAGVGRVELHGRVYRRGVSQQEMLTGNETSFWGRYLRHRLGDADWARFRQEVAEAAAEALPDPVTRVDQLLLAVATKRFGTRP
jgi:ubiquinone/menaquinone biosynthesis C-methylase UbiE